MRPRLPAVTTLRTATRSAMLRSVARNCGARALAIVGLGLAAIVVARIGGPSAVGAYALLRMLPSLVGVLCIVGLPSSMAYFLAEPRRGVPRLWPTLAAIYATGSVAGMAIWLLLTPLIAHTFFPHDTASTIVLAAPTIATQMFLTTSKTALQGLGRQRSSDVVIALEELSFLPCYLVMVGVHLHGSLAIIAALGSADVLVGILGWRLVSRHTGWRWRRLLRRLPLVRPDLALARQVLSYGMRGQLGGLLTLLNLRLDFAILGAMAGPAVLGTYAIASKYAELLRLPGIAATWVTYPRFARQERAESARRARAFVLPAIGLVVSAAVPLLLVSGPAIHLLYGARFDPAVTPARILILGVLLCGASGVASGFLYGSGRPGLNSTAMGVGLTVTVILDVLLIPRFGAIGAAFASMTTYLLTDTVLISLLLRASSSRRAGQSSGPQIAPDPAGSRGAPTAGAGAAP